MFFMSFDLALIFSLSNNVFKNEIKIKSYGEQKYKGQRSYRRNPGTKEKASGRNYLNKCMRIP